MADIIDYLRNKIFKALHNMFKPKKMKKMANDYKISEFNFSFGSVLYWFSNAPSYVHDSFTYAGWGFKSLASIKHSIK